MLENMKNSVEDFFANLGERLLYQLRFAGFTLILLFKTFPELRYVWFKRKEILKQMYVSGVKSIIVCSIVAFFGGMILALQAGLQFKVYGQQNLVPVLIMNIMNKEMGAMFTAIILTAFSGAAMAAEIGTMKISEEIDALEMMSISPIRFLVMPKVVAMAIMLPTLTVYTIILAVVGGSIVSYFQLGLTFDLYYKEIFTSIHLKDLYVGMFKSVVFALSIVGISCANGLWASNGAIGVGRATRVSVVSSYLSILIFGYFITSIFYRL